MIYFKLSFEEVQKKVPEMTREEYLKVYQELKKVETKPPDPNIVFNDSTATLEISVGSEDLILRNNPLKYQMESLFPGKLYGSDTKAKKMEVAFHTPEAAKLKAEFLDKSRDGLRDLPYKEPPNAPPDPDDGTDDLDNLKAVINSNNEGFVLGGDHGDPARNKLVEDLLKDPGHGGVDMLFIEELHVSDQALVEQFLSAPTGTPMPPALLARAKKFAGIKEMLEQVQAHNDGKADNQKIKIYGIDSTDATRREGPLAYETRCAMMNTVAKEVMDKAIRDNPGKKFMAFVGQAHANTHAGGVPGIAQLFGVPALALDEKSKRLKIDPEKKNLRGMPTPEEIKRIEKELANDPGYEGLAEGPKTARMAKATTKARFETVKEALREPYLTLKQQIVNEEQGLFNAKRAGLDTPEMIQQTTEKITKLKTQLEEAKVNASKLLEKYIDVNPDILKEKDGNDMTLLHFAAVQVNPTALQKILAKDPSLINAPNKAGNTAAHIVLEGREFADEGLRKDLLDVQALGLKALTDAGADPNVKNKEGKTPLHLAALNGNAKAADNLITKGAKTDIEDERGWTAYDTALGSTKTSVEKVFYDKGLAKPQLKLPSKKPSVVDILVSATLCENKKQADEIREMYEKLYADELLRPILETAAVDAMQPRDPPKEGGVRIFVADRANTGRLFNAPEYETGGQGGYDEKANSFLIAGKPDKDPKQGTLIHEMTHMATRKMFGEDTVPYEKGSEDETKYKNAIMKDVQAMHLMTASNPAEKRLKDRICGRMDTYAKRGGDEQLLQEFIVGVPQMIAEYGPETVQKFAPNLLGCFKSFTAKCQDKMQNDPKYKDLRAKIDNTKLDEKLKKNPPELPRTPDTWVGKDAEDLTVDGVMKKIETEYLMRHGQAELPKGVTLAYSPDVYQIKDPTKKKEFEDKMAKVKAGLTASMNGDGLATEISPDSIRTLVLETVTLAERRSADELEEAVGGHAANWTRDTKVRLVNRKLEKGEDVTATEIAEATLLLAQDKARSKLGSDDPTATVEVDPGKHKDLVKNLAKDLDKKMKGMSGTDRKTKLPDLLGSLSDGLVNDPKTGFKIKDKKAKTNPDHVSMDKKALRKVWVEKLKKL